MRLLVLGGPEPTTKAGVRFGYARLRGIWHDRTIAVDEQLTPPANALTDRPLRIRFPVRNPPEDGQYQIWITGTAGDVDASRHGRRWRAGPGDRARQRTWLVVG
jgi:hypothetical protein